MLFLRVIKFYKCLILLYSMEEENTNTEETVVSSENPVEETTEEVSAESTEKVSEEESLEEVPATE
jgi:hypothetical protein